MSPEAQRIAIAEACRWIRNGQRFTHPNVKGTAFCPPVFCEMHLPDYLNDLNAMAEARRTLTTDTQRSRYFEALHQIVGPIGDNPQWAMIDASAKQHAEAFVKTIGEWKE